LLFAVKASSGVGSEASKQESDKGEEEEEEPYEEYEVEIEQPYGLKFAKGRDGGTYIDAIAPGGSADKAGVFTVGDRVIATRYTLHVFFFFFSFCKFLYLRTRYKVYGGCGIIFSLGVGFHTCLETIYWRSYLFLVGLWMWILVSLIYRHC